MTRLIDRLTTTPTAIPATASHAKVPTAWVSENAPVVAAITAIRMQVRPEASFKRLSPSRICIKRLGMGLRPAMAETAIGSVGDRIADRAKATASGMAGIIQWMKKPNPRTVNTTSPMASSRMTLRSR